MRGRFRLRRRAALAPTLGALAIAAAGLAGFPTIASGASRRSEYVSTHGNDVGNCIRRSPCATIDYAISRAASGETIHVWKGTYHQTVDVDKPVTIRRS